MKIEPNMTQDLAGNPASKPPDTCRAVCPSGADMSLRTSFAGYIQKANQLPEGDASAVRQAKKLLQSGELESWENIQEVAENMLMFGI